MNNLKPNYQRAKNAIILIWIMLGLEIISFVSGYFQYRLLQTIAKGGEISMTAARMNDMREKIIGIIYLLTYIVSAVIFIQWFRRAYFNLHQKVEHLSYSEGMAAGCWFIPFVNLYRPYQIMRELYRETRLINSIDYNSKTTRYINWWWGLWITNGVFGQIIFRTSLKAKSIEALINTTTISMIGNIVGLILSLITIKVIKDYAKLESLLFEVKEEVTTQDKLILP